LLFVRGAASVKSTEVGRDVDREPLSLSCKNVLAHWMCVR
jgi:hypothetical protein